MNLIMIIISLFVILIIVALVGDQRRKEKIALMTPEEKQKYLEEKQTRLAEEKQRRNEITYGAINTEMICPHCQTKGNIRTAHINLKKGVSGGKATAAVLTGGLSLLAVGLSRKEETTQAHCDNCENT